jgi:hypothetical protein
MVELTYYSGSAPRSCWSYEVQITAPKVTPAPATAKCTTISKASMPRVLCTTQWMDVYKWSNDCDHKCKCAITQGPSRWESDGISRPTAQSIVDIYALAACKVLGYSYLGKGSSFSKETDLATCYNGKEVPEVKRTYWTSLSCCK